MENKRSGPWSPCDNVSRERNKYGDTALAFIWLDDDALKSDLVIPEERVFDKASLGQVITAPPFISYISHEPTRGVVVGVTDDTLDIVGTSRNMWHAV